MADLKILAVDDSPTMRRIIINTLKRAGYTDVADSSQRYRGSPGFRVTGRRDHPGLIPIQARPFNLHSCRAAPVAT